MKKPGKNSAAKRFKIKAKFKLKKNSSIKKRVKITASGIFKTKQVGKRHNMINKSSKFIRARRGTTTRKNASRTILLNYGA